MKLKLYALYDRALETYGAPMVYTATGQAIRDFADQVNTKDSQLYKHPEDYSLFYLGEYDNELGAFNPIAKPALAAKATDHTLADA